MIDFFHAAEQLKAATDAAYGENHVRGRAQYEAIIASLLRHEPSRVERVIRRLRYQCRQASTAAADSASTGLFSPHVVAPYGLRFGGPPLAADRV